MYIVLMGPPGTGKGTQAAVMAEKLGWPHISTGEMLRQAVREGTELGAKANEYMSQGKLVPDELIIGVLLDRIAEPDCEKGCILDGFPRNLHQAEELDKALASKGKAIDKALYIAASDEALVKRLGGRWLCPKCGAVYHEVNSPPAKAGVCDKCGSELYQRDDDKPETVKQRLALQSPPADMVAHYRNAGKLVEVDGEQDIEAVRRDLLAAVGA